MGGQGPPEPISHRSWPARYTPPPAAHASSAACSPDRAHVAFGYVPRAGRQIEATSRAQPAAPTARIRLRTAPGNFIDVTPSAASASRARLEARGQRALGTHALDGLAVGAGHDEHLLRTVGRRMS